MKITPISIYRPIKPSFKEYNSNDFYAQDYETQNYITIKDAIISTVITSSICYLITLIIDNKNKIINYIPKIKK